MQCRISNFTLAPSLQCGSGLAYTGILAHTSLTEASFIYFTCPRGDTLYGLSRYPADDADDLLAGQMATADGICRMVEDGLRVWGLRGPRGPFPPGGATVA